MGFGKERGTGKEPKLAGLAGQTPTGNGVGPRHPDFIL